MISADIPAAVVEGPMLGCNYAEKPQRNPESTALSFDGGKELEPSFSEKGLAQVQLPQLQTKPQTATGETRDTAILVAA